MAVLNYAQLADVKTYLGITGTSEDTRLAMLLDQSYYYINNLLGVDTLNQTTKTDRIREVDSKGGFYVKNFPTTALLTIDGTSYTGTINVDYQILNDRYIQVSDISEYLGSLDFLNFDVTYTAGRDRDETGTTPGADDTLPSDIILAQMMTVGLMLNTARSGGAASVGGVSSYKLGEESITYGGGSSSSSGFDETAGFDPTTIQTFLSKYIKGDVYSI